MNCEICRKKNDEGLSLILECKHTICTACHHTMVSGNKACSVCVLSLTQQIEDLQMSNDLTDSMMLKKLQKNAKGSILFQNNVSIEESNFLILQMEKMSITMPTIKNIHVLKTYEKLGPYLETLQDPETSHLPYEGPYKFEDGTIYSGQIKNGLREGLGIEICSDGRIYEGIWRNNVKNIKGRIIHKNGNVYEGEIKDNLAHGKGRYKCEVGSPAEICESEGQWQYDMMNGNGRMVWADGSVYEGNFSNDCFDGYGKHRWNNGDIYEGEWKNDLMQGKGFFRWADGSSYFGEYVEDQMHGFGVYQRTNGTKFVGEWLMGEKCGQGTEVAMNGKEKKGIWRKGKLERWI